MPPLQACIDGATSAAQLPPCPMAYGLYSLAKRVDIDSRRGIRYSRSTRDTVLGAADCFVGLLLGSAPTAARLSDSGASPPQPTPVQQLDGKHLSLLAWSLAVLAKSEPRLMGASVRVLCSALAERACWPGVMGAAHGTACRNWAGVLYGLAKAGIRCCDDARVGEAFRMAVECDLPELLRSGGRCEAQSLSITVVACAAAGFTGSMQPFVSAVAGRVGGPPGGVDMMARAPPQVWSNLLHACAKLERRGGEGLGREGMCAITRRGAAAMARAACARRRGPSPQQLANFLWGASHFDWRNAKIIGMLVAAVVEQVGGCTSQAIANVLWALARFKVWCEPGRLGALAAAMVARASDSPPQEVAGVVWALPTIGWYDARACDALLEPLLGGRRRLTPLDLSNAMYGCGLASHGGTRVDELARTISRQAAGQWRGWSARCLSNALYAWAMLSASGAASAGASPAASPAGSPSAGAAPSSAPGSASSAGSAPSAALDAMAQALFREVNSRGPVVLSTPAAARQLYAAHLEAGRVGLQGGGLQAAGRVAQAAASMFAEYQAEVRDRLQGAGRAKTVQRVGAVLQGAGYNVEFRAVVGGDCCVELLVHDGGCPNGIAVDLLLTGSMLRHPKGQLTGKMKLKHAHMQQRCDGLVLLDGEDVKQPAQVVQRLGAELRHKSLH